MLIAEGKSAETNFNLQLENLDWNQNNHQSHVSQAFLYQPKKTYKEERQDKTRLTGEKLLAETSRFLSSGKGPTCNVRSS